MNSQSSNAPCCMCYIQIRREAHSISNVTRIETSVRILMTACDGAGAVALLTGGRGGSATSESVKSGIGAIAGGCADLSMVVMRPGWAGSMKFGVLFPMFKQEFTAEMKFKMQGEQQIHRELQRFEMIKGTVLHENVIENVHLYL